MSRDKPTMVSGAKKEVNTYLYSMIPPHLMKEFAPCALEHFADLYESVKKMKQDLEGFESLSYPQLSDLAKDYIDSSKRLIIYVSLLLHKRAASQKRSK